MIEIYQSGDINALLRAAQQRDNMLLLNKHNYIVETYSHLSNEEKDIFAERVNRMMLGGIDRFEAQYSTLKSIMNRREFLGSSKSQENDESIAQDKARDGKDKQLHNAKKEKIIADRAWVEKGFETVIMNDYKVIPEKEKKELAEQEEKVKLENEKNL